MDGNGNGEDGLRSTPLVIIDGKNRTSISQDLQGTVQTGNNRTTLPGIVATNSPGSIVGSGGSEGDGDTSGRTGSTSTAISKTDETGRVGNNNTDAGEKTDKTGDKNNPVSKSGVFQGSTQNKTGTGENGGDETAAEDKKSVTRYALEFMVG